MHRYVRRGLAGLLFDAANVLAMALMIVVMVYPFLNQLALSWSDGFDAQRGGIYLLPRVFSTESYQLLFMHPLLLRGLAISILRVVVGTVTCVFMTGLLSYIVTIRTFAGRRLLRLLFLVTLYFSGGLIPFYLLIVRLHLINTFAVYWLPNALNAYYMLLMASYFQGLPDSLRESAAIDGSSELRIYLQIIFPMAAPVFAAIAVYAAVFHWNSWFDVLIYNPSGKWDTLQVYLRRLLLEIEALQRIRDQQLLLSRLRNVSSITYRAATTMLVTVPIVLVYPFLQRYFIGGITLGAVKE